MITILKLKRITAELLNFLLQILESTWQYLVLQWHDSD